MSAPTYNGLCLGGPNRGKMMESDGPVVQIEQKVLGFHKNYYYVPLFGRQGYWLWEDETKGSMPYDDIIRILVSTYIEHYKQ